MSFGIDEDWNRLTPAQMLAAGKTFVVGYVSEDTTGKNLSATEVRAYLASGVDVLLVYEYSVTAISGGATKGTRDAKIGISQAQAMGYPAGCAVAFAVDQDTSSDPTVIDPYCRAFTAACHAASYRSMVYGGLATVKRCADLGLVDLLWQTYAWSGSPTVWDKRAAIRQVQNAVTIAGKRVDLDTSLVDDFGQWRARARVEMEQTDAVIGPLSRGNSVGDVLADAGNLRDEFYNLPGVHAKNPPPPGSRFDLLVQAASRVLTGELGSTATVTQEMLNAAVLAAMQDPSVLAGLATALASHIH